MIHIHICYRWDDREPAEPLVRFLQERLGEEQVSFGINCLTKKAQDGDWLLVVIGSSWNEPVNAAEPFIRHLGMALQRSLRVVPLVVAGETMPAPDRVPHEIQPLFQVPPWELTPERWKSELERLLEILLRRSGAVPSPALPTPSAQKPGAKVGERFRSLLARFRSAPSERPKMREEAEEADYDLYDTSIPEAPAPEPPQSFTRSAPPAERETSPPPAKPEPVLLGASAPTAVKPGCEFTANFTAYVKTQEEEVRRILEQRSPRSELHLGEESCQWRQGTKVKVRLRGRHLSVDPPEQSFVWNGGRNISAFDVEVAEEAPEETIVLKFDVLIEDSVVARLRMDLTISAVTQAEIRHAPTVAPARTAFASYASLDRSRVLDRVDALTTNAGIQFYMDCIDLHQGEEWKPALAEAIRLQELFMLFWSSHSATSPWVDWELDLAKQHKPREFIQIQALQPNLPPPEGFEARHGGSVYLWVREGNEAVRHRANIPP